ncbi:hypothetical protein HK405_005012 [Cladochytrium tenue]|nr:hypothetical protein HK405_005012 [Cladochytrium tenue]
MAPPRCSSHRVAWLPLAVLILTVADLALVVAEIALALEERCGSGGGDGDKEEEKEWLVILRHLSTGILILFGFEIGLRLFVFGHRYFTRSPVHLFDAAVVILSIVFDFTLRGLAETVSGLIILLRGWRVIRVIDGVVLMQSDEYEDEIKALKQKIRGLEDELATARLAAN